MIEMNFENKTFLVWFKDIYSSQHEMEFKMVQNVEKDNAKNSIKNSYIYKQSN